MTREEEQLLLKDLCARLPYGVKINIWNDYTLTMEDKELNAYHLVSASYDFEYRKLRPYLRPMSSMTKEEENELDKIDKESSRIFFDDLHSRVEKFGREKLRGFLPDYKTLDYLIAHHFDYRGLIPMGLALEAKEWMYKIE